MHEQQDIQFSRVSKAIAASILAFLASRLAGDGVFRADDLRRYVAANHPTAPASADRILRSLRQRGECDYLVVSRSESRYRILSVGQRVAA